MLVVCMAGPLDTGQQIATYLLFNIIPLLIYHLVYFVLPEDSMSFRLLEKTIAQTSAWRLRGHPHDARPKRFKCFKKPKKKMVSEEIQNKTIKHTITKSSPLTSCRHFSPPSRLVVVSRTHSAVSFIPSSGLHGSWHTKVFFLAIQRSDSTRTYSPSGSTTMHRDAWPTPPTYSRTSTSSTTRGR